ncbi:hypothetical protein C4571_02460 [Candidatus Parcubacteria bacterium]|nr:MAG: hypothetical protein C4571_02460 [Candidatus Parcubacteria bacterium]
MARKKHWKMPPPQGPDDFLCVCGDRLSRHDDSGECLRPECECICFEEDDPMDVNPWEEIKALEEEGTSIEELARELGVG